MPVYGFHPEALLEFAEATSYYLREASPQVAHAFVEAVASAIDGLLKAPTRWRVIKHPNIRRYVFRRFPYVLYYRWEMLSALRSLPSSLEALRAGSGLGKLPSGSCRVVGSCDGGGEEPLKRRQRIRSQGGRKGCFRGTQKPAPRRALYPGLLAEEEIRFSLTRGVTGLCYGSCDKRARHGERSSLGSGLSWFQRLSVDY